MRADRVHPADLADLVRPIDPDKGSVHGPGAKSVPWSRMGAANRSPTLRVLVLFYAVVTGLLVLASCRPGRTTPTTIPTCTPGAHTPTPTSTLGLGLAKQELFQTYARGELLPDMRAPIERSATGEGGWYVVVGTGEGWAQFLSRMGQPAEIWEPVQWEEEILIGALLGVRRGRGFKITIADLDINGVGAVAVVSFDALPSEPVSPSWITYPFHFIRVPRVELPLGPVSFRFVAEDRQPAELAADTIDLDIIWLPGEKPTYPTPTPILATSTPEPTPTSTPVPHLQVIGTVLEVMTDTLTLRIVPSGSDWEYVDLMEATSIFFKDGQPLPLTQLVPGTTIGVLGYPGEAGSIQAAHIDVLRLPIAQGGFASYQPRSVTLSTIYGGYTLPLSADAISAAQPLTQTLNLTQTTVLARRGFVVVPSDYRAFSELYAGSWDASDETIPPSPNDPVFISADSVLHISQLLFDHILRSTERAYLLPELAMLDREMFALSWAQYEARQSPATPGEQRIAATALRNATYFAVPLALLDPVFTPPDVISPVVNAELSLIAASEGITIPPLLDLPEVPDSEKPRVDYSQFAPAGHYARNPDRSRYFQAITWHRAIAFRLDQREETRSAALIAHTLNTHSAPRVLWQRIHDLLTFFHGRDASFTPAEYGDALAAAWGEGAGISALVDENLMDAFVEAVHNSPLPENPTWMIREAKRHIDRDWRFLSQPFRIDTYIFEQMTGDYVGDVENPRDVPSSIDLAAVLGSLEAYRVASQTGVADYADYIEQVDKVRDELSALRTVHWTEDLYWNWLYIYRALLQDKNASYPDWMRSSAWKRKQLQAVFGDWTHLQHDADAAGQFTPVGEPSGNLPPWGYVEPQPEVYARLTALTRMIVDGLESRLMVSSADRDALLELEAWLSFLQDIARRELTSQVLTEQEIQRLARYGSLVAMMTRVALDGKADSGDEALEEGYDEAVVLRVVTAGEKQLVEATGRVDVLYVVVEHGQERYLVRGGVYSHYEFVWPGEEPLTDARWREMLDAAEAPSRPLWVGGFVIP